MDGAASPTLLLTRPFAASERFLTALETKMSGRVASVISPVLAIERTGDMPDVGQGTTLAFTSSHAVAFAREADVIRGRRCLTVGARTAEQATAAGGLATCLGEDVEGFLAAAKTMPAEPDILHLRGVHTRGDLAGELQRQGWGADEAIIYDQRPVPLTRAAKRLVEGPQPVILPLFSPRSAALASALGQGPAPLVVIAMSAAVADEWSGGGRVEVLKNPTADAMLSKVAEAFRRDHLGDPLSAH